MGNRKVVVGDKKIPVVDMLYSMPSVPRIVGLTFDPTSEKQIVEDEIGLKVNQWRGFKTTPFDGHVSDEEMEPLIDYLKYTIGSGDEQAYKWVLHWLAHIIQLPGHKTGTALVLLGDHGAGKTFLGEIIMASIIGDAHMGATNNVESLVSRFNTSMDSKILIRCEEALHAWQKSAASQMKSLVTDDFMWIEPKGVNKFRKPNHMRFVFTSNNREQALLIDPEDSERRYTVLSVSHRKIGDIPYWEEFAAWCDENISKIMRWFLQVEMDWEFIRKPYVTEAKTALQRTTLPIPLQWIRQRLSEGFLISEMAHNDWFDAYKTNITQKEKDINKLNRTEWPDFVSVAAVERDYADFSRRLNQRHFSNTLWPDIQKVLPPLGESMRIRVKVFDARTGQEIEKRIRSYKVPPILEIVAFLREKHGKNAMEGVDHD